MAYNTRRISRARYESMLREELENNFPHMSWIDATLSRKQICLIPRWRVFTKLREANFSLPAIGQVSGYHHTSVLHGLRRLPHFELQLQRLYEEAWPVIPEPVADPLGAVLGAVA